MGVDFYVPIAVIGVIPLIYSFQAEWRPWSIPMQHKCC